MRSLFSRAASNVALHGVHGGQLTPPHPQPTALSPDGAPVPGAEGFGKDIRGFCDWSVGEQRPVCMALSVMPHVPDHQKGYVILAFFVTSSF